MSFDYSIPSALQVPHHLLNTKKWFLEDEDVAKIRHHLDELGKERSVLESIIQRAEAIVQDLKGKRERIDWLEARHRTLLSSIRMCPPEIIERIMYTCVENDAEHEPNPRRAPLVFCYISKEWRQLAINTPRLWKNVTLNIRKGCTWEKLQLLASMEEWLRRTRSTRLSVRITGLRWYDQKSSSPGFEALLGVAGRWSGLVLTEMSPSPVFEGLEFPNLRYLEFCHTTNYEGPYNVYSFQAAPSLEKITLRSGNAPCPPLRMLAWNNITNWTFHSTDVKSALLLLQQAPQLQVYHIGMLNDPSSSFKAPTVILRHCSLRGLNLACQTTSGLEAFCGGLELRALQSLSVIVHRSQGRDEPFKDEFWHFIASTSSSLQHIQLDKNLCTVGFAEHLATLSSLKSLHVVSRSLSKDSLNDEFVKSLAYDVEHHYATLPLLEEVRLQGILNFSCASLVSFITSRTRISSKNWDENAPLSALNSLPSPVARQDLRRLHIDIDTPFFSNGDLEIFKELKSLRYPGLGIVVTCRGKSLW